MRSRALLAVLAIALTVVGFAGSGVGTSHYSVSASPAVETPNRDVTFQGQSFEITQLGRVDPGNTVEVTVDAPSGESYDVYLYDDDRNILDRHRDPDSSTVSFDIPADDSNYPPGTYVIAVEHDGGFEAVTPLVVSGYHASVDAPDSAEVRSEVTVEASVTTVDDAKSIDGVEVVIGNEDDQRRVALVADGDGEYSETIELDTLPEGDYSMYVVVQGSERVLETKEILGVSDAQSFAIESSSTGSDSPNGGGSSGDSPNGGTTDDSTDDGSSGADDGPSNDGSDGSSSDDGTTTDTPSTVTSTATSTTDATTTADENVITPAASSPETTTETGGQSLGFLPAIVALLWVGFAAYRRR